jgi:hypothetical protein
MPGDPKECRDHAKNCLRLAAESRTQEGRQLFEALAQKWLALATDLEAAAILLRPRDQDRDDRERSPGRARN